MFIYGQQHAWQNDKAVQQILVFNSLMAKIKFDEAREEACRVFMAREAVKLLKESKLTESSLMAARMKFVESYEENNTGATFKLRAVANGKNGWSAVVRCGVTGNIICERPSSYDSSDLALLEAQAMLKEKVREYADEELSRG